MTSASLQQPTTELAYAVPSPPSFTSNISLASTLSTTGSPNIPTTTVPIINIKEEEPVVAIGIFPKSHIQIREQLEDAERRLNHFNTPDTMRSSDLYGSESMTEGEDDEEEVEIGVAREINTNQGRLLSLNLSSVSEEEGGEESGTSTGGGGFSSSSINTSISTSEKKSNSSLGSYNNLNSPTSPTSPNRFPPQSKSSLSLSSSTSQPNSPTKMKNRASITSLASLARFSIVPTPSPRVASMNYGVKSLDDLGMVDNRPLAPIPNLKCGDETSSGLEEPLIDEIACTLREWSTLLHSHLFNKNYDLFANVRNHIEVLHIGRRQLLAGSLSDGEKAILRGKMVRRLVRGNREQGLDIIVRHPNWGGLVEGDGEALEEGDRKSWVSGVRMCKFFDFFFSIFFSSEIENFLV